MGRFDCKSSPRGPVGDHRLRLNPATSYEAVTDVTIRWRDVPRCVSPPSSALDRWGGSLRDRLIPSSCFLVFPFSTLLRSSSVLTPICVHLRFKAWCPSAFIRGSPFPLSAFRLRFPPSLWRRPLPSNGGAARSATASSSLHVFLSSRFHSHAVFVLGSSKLDVRCWYLRPLSQPG